MSQLSAPGPMDLNGEKGRTGKRWLVSRPGLGWLSATIIFTIFYFSKLILDLQWSVSANLAPAWSGRGNFGSIGRDPLSAHFLGWGQPRPKHHSIGVHFTPLNSAAWIFQAHLWSFINFWKFQVNQSVIKLTMRKLSPGPMRQREVTTVSSEYLASNFHRFCVIRGEFEYFSDFGV